MSKDITTETKIYAFFTHFYTIKVQTGTCTPKKAYLY